MKVTRKMTALCHATDAAQSAHQDRLVRYLMDRGESLTVANLSLFEGLCDQLTEAIALRESAAGVLAMLGSECHCPAPDDSSRACICRCTSDYAEGAT